MQKISPLAGTIVTIDGTTTTEDKLDMNLIRLIVIALIVYLVIQIIKRWLANKTPTPSNLEETKMVQCKVCQLHIPENEALLQSGEYYCSQEHLEDNQD